ncbi:5-methylcytosine restriction system specificity protein McrC [Lysinibacillus xylanilyticus]|uniref:5-methylcytosine restriction system specificity protein McrC n=1 Tax=Lysinibacillus xylanilyticus TaxID=582475 RepID=UPI003D093FC5
MTKNIPIQNIYYMLSYCAGILPEKERVHIDGQEETDLLELFAQALIRRLKPFVKRGFYKEYIQEQSSLVAIKGKILFKESIAEQAMIKARLVCQYDEFSENILHNQILKTTIYRLLKYSGLKSDTLAVLKRLYPFFQPVRVISLEQKHFDDIKLHKNNSHYKMLLSICYILFQNLLVNEEEGTITFVDYNREKRMNDVFEEFIRKFYILKLKRQYSVGRENLKWQKLHVIEGDYSLIPKMQTDITLNNEITKIIIDTKYYKHAIADNHKGDKKIIAANLYQMFSYLSNAKQKERMVGILLYPQTDKAITQLFEMQGYLFKVVTVNLNEHWAKIEERLLEIIQI